jgi:hypothetical protein
MLNVHLFFVKLFGCHLVEVELPMDIGSFSNAILAQKAHPNVYLKFGFGPTLNGEPIAGMSDVGLKLRPSDGTCLFGAWFYYINHVAIMVMYSVRERGFKGLENAWHPRFGSNKLRLTDFDEADDPTTPA